jgi:uncharacterized Zn finger protein
MYGYYQKESVAQQVAKAKNKLAKLQKKDDTILPVIIEGSKLVSNFWGKAWNDNLKVYADYSSRIDRGRSYIKNGFVFDLKIEQGLINSIVNGSGNKTYEVTIDIKALSKSEQDNIYSRIGNQIDSLEDLVEGKFPKDLTHEFLSTENGLFPKLSEMKMACTCPDWAHMCKHISATLYAVGTRIDQQPLMLFTLRGLDVSNLIKKSIDTKINSVIKNANNKSDRVIDDSEIEDIFGIEI